jgi:putative N6-adenine-specific DNA methylase
MRDRIDLIATATFGLESPVAREVAALGYETTVADGRVDFTADVAAIPRANINLRCADRVLVKVGSFPADDFGVLFEGTKALPWEEWLPENANFPVSGKSVRSKLYSVPDCQALVKKAIVERLKTKYRRSWFDEDGPLYAVEVALLADVVTLTIDTTGPGLHKRGYRDLSVAAPLKETLAAAMISLARWYPDRPFVDPCCGSGTIPVEAALIGCRIAPGIGREFAAQAWPNLPPQNWKYAREEAWGAARPNEPLDITGSDIDGSVLTLAERHARRAGVGRQVRFVKRPVAELVSEKERGVVVCNPPYGERIGEAAEVERLYRALGQASKRLPTWSFNVITAYQGFEKLFGRRADKRRKLYNGRIECQYYQYTGAKVPRR